MRQSLQRYLFTFIRERARQRWTEEHVGIPRVVAAGTLLDPDALTIGFARRFAGYKRPELVFRDPERLARILNATGRPVQIIFAGKSHPADDIGKHHLQRVFAHALDPLFGGRVAFVDDYDLHVAHFLVQGCDVWLNTPRKPLEASGTSGMKAAINGVPHLSIGDGWWAEGYNGSNGWVIDGGVAGDNDDAVDAADADALYRLLEDEVVPAFYDRDRGRHPAPLARDRQGGDPHRSRRASRRGAWSRNTSSALYAPAPSGSNERLAIQSTECHGSRSPSRAARCAAPKKSPSRAAKSSYCRDCWDKKIAVEEIVAREFALKRYIRAHSAEKYLDLSLDAEAPLRPAARRRRRLRSVPDADALPELRLGRPGLPPRRDPEGRIVLGDPRRRRRRRSHRAVGRRQVAPGDLPVAQPRARRLERRDVI